MLGQSTCTVCIGVCRNLSLAESSVAILMAVAVGALGALVLTSNFYHDLWIFFFCFIMAGCQYCLLKVGARLHVSAARLL